MSSRRVVLGRSGWAGGQRRRSPRICALDARAKTTTTRDRRIKRKRHQLQNVSEFSDQVEDGKRQKDDPINSGKASTIPEKQVLEHILDTLQRRDTYEIFAEPVDPSEVVDYYEIIKEPMDFGTMRAKLHEGMYENLEQFKHDAFLITKNAMHFNSASTIYFRQARAIDELAKRVFHVLENEPENFEPEFAGTRRRSARRAQIESKDCRLSADFNKPAKLTTTTYPKYTLSSAAATSMPEKNSRGSVKPATVASPTNTRNNCTRDGRRSYNIETDRRSTYRPQSCFFNNNYNLFDPKSFNSVPVPGFDYRESLLLFVKDLGPTAHKIASQKIQGLQENPSSFQTAGSNPQVPALNAPNLQSFGAWNNTTNPFKLTDWPYGHCSTPKTTAKTIDFKAEDHHQDNAFIKERTNLVHKEASNLPTGLDVVGAPKRGRIAQNHKRREFCSSDGSISKANTTAKKPTSLVVEPERFDENVRPVVLALEYTNANGSESKWRNKKNCTHQNRNNQKQPNITEEKKGGGSSSQSILVKQQPIISPILTQPAGHVSTGFTFDMQFLKAKLNKMKVLGQPRFPTILDGGDQNQRGLNLIEQGSYGGYRGIWNTSSSCSLRSETSTKSFSINRPFDTLDPKLTLQL